MAGARNPFIDSAKAEDVQDLLSHIAWSDVIRPALVHERDIFTKALVSATLGTPMQVQTNLGVAEISKEQLAGRIYGIDYIFGYLEKVLTQGARAVAELRSKGIS
jgi:hypothetical protein